jgi:hypothetical protein
MIASSWALRSAWSPEPVAGSVASRVTPLLAHLCVGMTAYLVGYLSTPEGRGDLAAIVAKARSKG